MKKDYISQLKDILQSYNITLVKSNGETKSLSNVLDELSNVWEQLNT